MPKEETKRYLQKYTKRWETDPELKDWLGPDPTDSWSATCKYCRVTLKAHKKDLVGHSKTEKHKKSVEFDKAAKACNAITSTFKPVLSEKTGEFKIAASIAEHRDFQEIEERVMESVRRSSSEVEQNLKNWWKGEFERMNAESEDRARKLCAEEFENLRAEYDAEEEGKHCIYCMKNRQTILKTESAIKELKENLLGERNAWEGERRLLLEIISKLAGKEGGGEKGEGEGILLKTEENWEENS